jgi:hypothetical protein
MRIQSFRQNLTKAIEDKVSQRYFSVLLVKWPGSQNSDSGQDHKNLNTRSYQQGALQPCVLHSELFPTLSQAEFFFFVHFFSVLGTGKDCVGQKKKTFATPVAVSI